MSKYIKLEGLKWHSPDESLVKPLTEFYITESDIADLPTIEVSEDCISREWLFKNFQTVCENVICSECPFDDDDCRLADYIKNAPSVIPSRAEGEWVDKGDYAECSLCGAKSGTQFNGVEPVPRKTKFCPDCGAKMKGAE